MSARPRLLVFSCHEGWIAQLDGLPYDLDILVGLPGRAAGGWDTRARPVPGNARLVRLEEVAADEGYAAVVVHNPSDLLLARRFDAPRLFIIHNTLEGRLAEESGAVDGDAFRQAFATLVEQTGAHVVAVSPLKAQSWGRFDGSLVFGIDAAAFGPHVGSLARGLRIANHVQNKARILRWDLHEAAFRSLPITLVGNNPGRRDASPARSFAHLRDLLRVHRFYIHTADPALEDGYNMATVEAMASGLPVIGSRHPSSPIRHGVDGFLSDDPAELRQFATTLLEQPEVAAAMGREARARAVELFAHAAFARRFDTAVVDAGCRFEAWRTSCSGTRRSN
jgi:glycosyltransferase involved in cell wall biosynthesis